MPAKTKRGRKRRGLGDQLAGVMSHPLRVKILSVLNREVASPKELSERLGSELGHISYHVTELKKAGCIELVDTEPRRGATEHYYRANLAADFDDEAWAKLDQKTRETVSKTVSQLIISEVLSALDSGSFDARPDRFLAWTHFRVDHQGWDEIVEMLNAMLERTEQIRVETTERLLEAGEDGESIVVASTGFERTPAL